VSDRDGEINVVEPTDMVTGVAIGNNSPFAIDYTTADERVDTANVSNVDDGVNRHVNDGDESTIPYKGTDDEHVLDAAIPWKKPSRPMAPEPEVPKIYKCKLSPLLYFHIVFVSIISQWKIEMRMNVLSGGLYFLFHLNR
jgi:hypothetical protein